MAAFPLIVGNNDGVLYIGFAQPRCLSAYESSVIKRFLGRAAQAILTASYYKRMLDENRRLTNLNSIAQLLVSRQPDPLFLHKIAGYALNVVAADAVTSHEYISGKGKFVNAEVAGHWRDSTVYDIINQHLSAKQMLQNNSRGIVYQNFQENIDDLPEDVKRFISSEGFNRRLGVLLRYKEEVFGVMFIYYRQKYELSPDDKRAIEILAAHAVIAMRVRRSFHETCSQIGHDFNRHISKLASRVCLVRDSIGKAPYVSEVFWNSEMGDLLRDVIDAKDDITRFARDFQEVGKVISVKCKPVNIDEFIADQIRRAQREMYCMESDVAAGRAAIEIDYKSHGGKVLAEIDESYVKRAIDAVLNNARQILAESKLLGSGHIVVELRSQQDIVGRSFAVISIADDGPGVPDGKKEEIFRLFYTTRGKAGGNGIG